MDYLMILAGPLLCREPLKYPLVAKGYPGFVMKYNTYNIADEFHVAYPSLIWRTSIHVCIIAKYIIITDPFLTFQR